VIFLSRKPCQEFWCHWGWSCGYSFSRRSFFFSVVGKASSCKRISYEYVWIV